jgi:hypothetical protein
MVQISLRCHADKVPCHPSAGRPPAAFIAASLSLVEGKEKREPSRRQFGQGHRTVEVSAELRLPREFQ